MTAFLPLFLVVLLGPIGVGCAMGAWSYWLPRHRLAVIFAASRRKRLATPPVLP